MTGPAVPGTTERPRVLIISADTVGPEMAGVGIRCWEIAQVLSQSADVTLAAVRIGEMPPSRVELISFEPHAPSALRPHIDVADMVVAQPQWPTITAWLGRSRARVIYDLYDPETLETIELFAHRSKTLRRLMIDLSLDRLDDALRTGTHFVCASEKQRDLWLGAMYGRRLIDARTYDRDPSFRSVIDVVPFGLPGEPPRARDVNAIRTHIPKLAPDGEIVLWNGGIWNWLDAAGAVRAFALLHERRPRAQLVFMGMSSSPAGLRASQEARSVAQEAGLLDRAIHFNPEWVSYADRGDWLLAADCALSTHEEHLETRFAFRTRLLDCFWAGLPIVCSDGDALAERVQREGLGETVKPRDPQALADALERVLQRGRASYAQALARVAEDYSWPKVTRPLVAYMNGNGAIGPPVAPFSRAPRRKFEHTIRSTAYRAGHLALRRGFGVGRKVGLIKS
ncbi:MAG TPA: glycosyltransferase family 4 protein [Solirubrobacteraceae bacterium]